MDTKDIKNFYNTSLKKSPGTYEHDRWFRTPQKKAGYDMTMDAIVRYSAYLPEHVERYLEVGPGPGTWTKFFLNKYPHATFDLVDISHEMLAMAREALGDSIHSYTETDFVEYSSNVTYDVFFSSRALEYFPDKTIVAKKIFSLLKPGGKGFIITKTPHYVRSKLVRRTVSQIHNLQISSHKLKEEFVHQGFVDVVVRPVTFVFPLFHSAMLDRMVHAVLSRLPMNPVSNFFAESYCILFKRP